MPVLHLLRHAKSSWDEPGIADHDRSLAPRGERAAGAMAVYLRQEGIAPDLVLCSSAKRTRQTLDGIRPGLPNRVEVEITRDLYEVSGREILRRLRRTGAGVGELLLIGHNPGMEDLALRLTGPGSDPEAVGTLESKFPTGALASLAFDGDWADLDSGLARLARFVVPKTLV